MKFFLIFTPILLLFSCNTTNTDTSINSNTSPVEATVIIDTTPPPLDTFMFSNTALKCFYHLGHSTGGEFYYKSAIESVHNTIIEVLQKHGKSGADIVFLIDKTGSMQNDIDSVRINLNLIIDQIESLDNVKLGIAVYGDKNVDGKNWWAETNLTNKYDKIRKFINQLTVSNGGDYPESVYDGIANVIQKTSWRKKSTKTILVIGDAPSLEDSLSNYNREDIISLCNDNNIKANIFPVLVTQFSAETFVLMTQYQPKIVKPLPTEISTDTIIFNANTDLNYIVTILSLIHI